MSHYVQMMFSIILALALVIYSSQARYANGVSLQKNLVSQMDQLEAQDNIQKSDLNSVIGQKSEEIMQRHADLHKLRQYGPNATKAIPEAAAQLGLTALTNKISKANLRGALEAKGPFTIFGPTNASFRRMPKEVKEALKNTTVLADFLKFHFLKGEVKYEDLKNELLAETLSGNKLRINIYKKDKTTVATAQCAPINITRVNNPASNGLIHVLNSVIIPPKGDAVTVLSARKDMTILTAAVQAAGLEGTLRGDGPFTIFAPIDDSFRLLPPGTLPKLLKNPVQLARILKYHVLSETYCSQGLTGGDVATVEGQKVNIKVSKDGVTINNQKVVQSDVSSTNGVIHVIERVLLPPAWNFNP